MGVKITPAAPLPAKELDVASVSLIPGRQAS